MQLLDRLLKHLFRMRQVGVKHSRRLSFLAVLYLAGTHHAWPADAPWIGDTLQGKPCSVYYQAGGYGPYDYTNPEHYRNKLPVVETYHFTPKVESLQGGENARHPLNDLHYTLRAFPNHHRALFALIQLHTTQSSMVRSLSSGAFIEPECFLQRAANFSPDDSKVQFLHGLYLHRLGRYAEAERKYQQALNEQPDSAEIRYNLALVLIEMGRPEDAHIHARRAYDAGYPLPGVRNRLEALGYTFESR